MSGRPIHVFIHLAHGFGATQWRARWERGEIIGLNDPLPYGYYWAGEDGCAIEHSEDRVEGPVACTMRLAVRLVLGFDLVHAWRNRRGITAAEIVWTHTESQYLAVLLLLRAYPRARRPKVIAQSVWLFDHWPRWSRLRRWAYAKLIADATVLTVHSPDNLRRARALFPACRSEMVLFGVRAESMVPRAPRAAHHPVRVLSLGNDRHRDWPTLIEAVRACPECELRIVAPRVGAAETRGAGNIAVVRLSNNDELAALYDWADLVAVPLRGNLHASGITVVEEATVFGVPVICTDTGGLRAYFGDGEVRYVPVADPVAWRTQIVQLAADGDTRAAMVERARSRMITGGLTSRRFGQRHAELSREALANHGGAMPPRPRRRGASGHSLFQQLLRVAVVALAVVPAVIASASDVKAPSVAGREIDLCQFRPTFSEPFNALSVSAWGADGSRWIAHTPWHGDFGDAAFADPRPGFPFRIKDGVLEIEARKGPDNKWQSGLLSSARPNNAGFSQRYGYFEMRAQLPPGPGTWPGFWLNANQPAGSKAPGVEIDVIEYYGQFPAAYHSA
ncbi:MAG: glycosyltransferase, partial [Stellaceae bacterium]